jgi:hypothetical protein
MKPTPQISHKQRIGFPLTDNNYQPTADTSCASTKEKCGAHRRDGFWRLGAEYHGDEGHRHDVTDFFVFTFMGVLCAWPIVSVVVAISRTLNGY